MLLEGCVLAENLFNLFLSNAVKVKSFALHFYSSFEIRLTQPMLPGTLQTNVIFEGRQEAETNYLPQRPLLLTLMFLK